MAATGGTGPYSWSIASGSLPSGLTLNPTTGAISGKPTAVATSNFTVRVTDSASPAATSSKALSIAVAATPTTVTIWPTTAVPSSVDGGADSSVELGVKFRSDVAGTITGIRFYKAATNTGTHVGNLWSSTGTKLATATFTNETASGWQQVNFSTPVPITANTVYVASYHANTGHYSADVNYFATSGVDNPPLHALANGVSGGNSVYAYGASSVFPTQTWNAANYWVDVVFSPASAPTLQSIAVTPANRDDPEGRNTAVHSDRGLLGRFHTELTTQVTWGSSSTAVATIGTGGLATGVSVGTAGVTATLGSVSGTTTLTVAAPTLQSIAVTSASPTIWKGATQQFAATGTYSDSSKRDVTGQVTWASSSTTVATISAGGLATGVSAGTTAITATLGSVSGTTTLTVAAPTLQKIAVTPVNPTIPIGATEQFTATGTYSDNSTQNLTGKVTWVSSNPAVAAVSGSGLATAVSAGAVIITATSGSVNGGATLTVEVDLPMEVGETPGQ